MSFTSIGRLPASGPANFLVADLARRIFFLSVLRVFKMICCGFAVVRGHPSVFIFVGYLLQTIDYRIF